MIGSWPADPGPAELHNRDDLASYAGVLVFGAVPEGVSALPPSDFRNGSLQLNDIIRKNFARVMSALVGPNGYRQGH